MKLPEVYSTTPPGVVLLAGTGNVMLLNPWVPNPLPPLEPPALPQIWHILLTVRHINGKRRAGEKLSEREINFLDSALSIVSKTHPQVGLTFTKQYPPIDPK